MKCKLRLQKSMYATFMLHYFSETFAKKITLAIFSKFEFNFRQRSFWHTKGHPILYSRQGPLDRHSFSFMCTWTKWHHLRVHSKDSSSIICVGSHKEPFVPLQPKCQNHPVCKYLIQSQQHSKEALQSKLVVKGVRKCSNISDQTTHFKLLGSACCWTASWWPDQKPMTKFKIQDGSRVL